MQELQGGNRDGASPFFDLIQKIIEKTSFRKKSISLLNIGSGIIFTFERLLYKKYGSKIKLTCMDRLIPDHIPDFIKFIQTDIEKDVFYTDGQKYNFILILEVLEHIDRGDEVLKKAFNALDNNGLLILTVPNLASVYSRFELLLGCQPHILEASNTHPDAGMGPFGRMNYTEKKSVHHIRGITYSAMCDILNKHGFKIIKTYGHSNGPLSIFGLSLPPALSVDVCYICKKDLNKI